MNTQRYLNRLFFVSSLGGSLLVLSVRSVQAAPAPVTPSPDVTPQLTDALETSELASDVTPAAIVPTPGTVETTAASLQLEAAALPADGFRPDAPLESASPTVAQVVTPGRATRSGPSYVAVGGNIGFGGSTALGRGNFVITSKVGLTNHFSARPGLVVGRSPTILLPVTVDFPVRSAIDDRIRVAPFVGGGLAISTRGGSEVRALAMGGVDVPISDRFTATASANAAFFSRTEIGVILGVGYNF